MFRSGSYKCGAILTWEGGSVNAIRCVTSSASVIVGTAAQCLIERLENKDQRSVTLLNIQDYAVPALTPRQTELHKRRQNLLTRADVQIAVAKVGRIESYKIEALGQ
jgi:hypothetical protein